MVDNAITAFFDERKEDYRKKTIKASMSEQEVLQVNHEMEEKFSLANWLPDAARRAGQMSITSHPCTFSHPSARKNKNGYVTPVLASGTQAPDGYLRTGNIASELDAVGNAAAIDVYKFLNIQLADGRKLFEHIEKDSPLSRDLLSKCSVQYEELRQGFLKMVENAGGKQITSSKIKQVYFPLHESEHYHLLSLVTNSGTVFEMRKRIDGMRYGERLKELRKLRKENKYSHEGFSEIYNITTIAYGGTKPQNISILNNRNGGKARLLLSVPPSIAEREVRFPKRDFFRESLQYNEVKHSLKKLHNIFVSDKNSDIPQRKLRAGRDRQIDNILEVIINRAEAVKAQASVQYHAASDQLPAHQRVWLLSQTRVGNTEVNLWLDAVVEDIVSWIAHAYEKAEKKHVNLRGAEKDYIRSIVEAQKGVL